MWPVTWFFFSGFTFGPWNANGQHNTQKKTEGYKTFLYLHWEDVHPVHSLLQLIFSRGGYWVNILIVSVVVCVRVGAVHLEHSSQYILKKNVTLQRPQLPSTLMQNSGLVRILFYALIANTRGADCKENHLQLLTQQDTVCWQICQRECERIGVRNSQSAKIWVKQISVCKHNSHVRVADTSH